MPPPDDAPPPGALATLQQVADAAGVHRSTASRALNPETAGRISPDVVARIAAEAARLGYRRDLLAASLRTSRTRLVGVLVPDLANPVFAPILAGAEAALAAGGYAVLVANARGAAGPDLLDSLLSRRAEGVILATAQEHDPMLDRCLRSGVAAVLANRADPAGRLPAVVPDDEAGLRLAVRHLVSLGHRRIGHLAGPPSVSTGQRRAQGFRDAMAEAGLPADAVEAASAYTREAGQDAAARLLARHRVTAIAAANDLLALGAFRALAARGLRCPADVSVTGHNDMPLVDMVQPPLTTVRIDQDRIGREAAALLLARLAAPDAPPQEVRLPPELVVRHSTAAPG